MAPLLPARLRISHTLHNVNLFKRTAAIAALVRNTAFLPAKQLESINNASMRWGEWQGWEHTRERNRGNVRLAGEETDLNWGTREGMLSEARRLCQTFPICDAILERFADYCVHPSGKVKWATPDHEWNKLAENYWLAWGKQCDAVGQNTFPQFLRIGIKSMKRDGDVFFHKENQNGLPKLRAIEGDRCTSARGGPIGYDVPLPSNVARQVAGVNVDSEGRTVSFRICARSGYGFFQDEQTISADEMFHLYSPMRFETYRGVTAFHTVLNDFRDLKETHDAEKLASKLASYQTIVERNAIGQARGNINPFGDPLAPSNDPRKLENIEAGVKSYIAHGDSVEMFMSERPAEGWRWFIQYLIRGAAVGLHLPFEFVWDMSQLGGASLRLMSKQAERTFTAEMDNIEDRLIDPVVSWVINDAMMTGKLPFNTDWYHFAALRPAHPTVDIGRESSANLSELANGVRTEDSICEEQGFDGHSVRVQRAGEVIHRLSLAKEIMAEHPDVSLDLALEMLGRTNAPYALQPTTPQSNQTEKK